MSCHSWTPPPLSKRGRGQDLPKIESLEVYEMFCQKWGINLKRGGSCRNGGGCHFFITLQFNHIYCVSGKSKVPFITFRIFSILSQPFKILIHVFIVLKPGIICTFLIHSGSLQKMLTALTQFEMHRKVNGQFFLSAQARCFLVLKRFQKR